MSTLKTTNVQHMQSLSPQISFTASTMILSASTISLLGNNINLPDSTKIGGNSILSTINSSSTQLLNNIFSASSHVNALAWVS